jgi:beta-glucosidase
MIVTNFIRPNKPFRTPKWRRSMIACLALLTDVLLASAGPSFSKSDQQARAMLSKMSLEEKIGQMTQVDMNAMKDKADIQKYAIGSMLSGGDSDPADISAAGWLKACAEYQSWALKSRLKIPLLYGIDAVHGHNNVDGAVIFPHNIGLGATHDSSLVEKAARISAQEVAGTGMHWAFAPCVAVALLINFLRIIKWPSRNPLTRVWTW